MGLTEPTLLQLMPPEECMGCIKGNEEIAAIPEADSAATYLRATVASLGRTSCARLETKAQEKRLIALAGSALFVGPHLISLKKPALTQVDAAALHPPALLF